jgi:2'-5' RNA ligase
MPKLDTLRAFVAINISMASAKAVAEAQRDLRSRLETLPLKISWVPPANIHQTMKFLGDIDKELVEGVLAQLDKAAGRVAPFSVEARGLGAFPNPAKPRVLWIGLDDPQGGLAKLNQAIEESLEEIGIARDKRRFHPHLTLGRIRKGRQDLTEVVDASSEVTFGDSTIAEVVLYESRLRRTGAEYVVLGRAPLTGWAGEQQQADERQRVQDTEQDT